MNNIPLNIDQGDSTAATLSSDCLLIQEPANMKLNINSYQLVFNLLKEQVRYFREMRRLIDEGLDNDVHEHLHVDSIEIIADSFGIPKDNTREVMATDIANTTGIWPENAYCRDWMIERLHECIEGKFSIEELINELQEESLAHSTK